MAVDMTGEGLIDEKTAIAGRSDGAGSVAPPLIQASRDVLTTGLPASPGAASGAIVLDLDLAQNLAERGEAVILVRVETSPEDIHGMHAAKGIDRARRHGRHTPPWLRAGWAAVRFRGWRCRLISQHGRAAHRRARTEEGDLITLDGTTGQVMAGHVPTIEPELVGDFGVLMGWADRHRRIKSAPMLKPRLIAALRAGLAPGCRPLPDRAHVL